jgi:cell pole-organizing protein PopZ
MAPSQQAKIATTTTKAFVIVVSIKNTDTTVPAFRHHIESLLPPNVVEAFHLVKQEGQHRVSGRLILHSSIAKTKANANAFAFILRQSTCDGQSVAAQVDPTRAPSVVSRSSVPSPPPQQQQQQQPEEHQPEEEEEKVADEEEEEEEEEKSDEEEDNDGTLQWKKSKAVASQFFQWLGLGNFDSVQAVASVDSSTSSIIDLNSVDRETVHMLFEAFFAETFATGSIIIVNNNNNNKDKKQRRRLESLVLAALRQQRILKTKRYSDGIVICSFARSDRTFAPFADRKTARDKLRERRDVLTADKGGVVVSRDFSTRTTTHDSSNNNNTNGGKSSSTAIFPINQSAVVSYTISSSACSWQDKNSTTLTNVRLGGSHKNNFQIKTKLPCTNPKSLELSFNGARVTGAYRATVWFHFQNNNTTTTTTQQEPFVIVRSVLIRAGGDADLYEIIQPTSPYVKKKAFFEKPTNKKDIVHPPPDDSSSGNSSGHGYNKKLKMFKVPLDVREMVQSREMESALIPPTFDISDKDLINNKVYSTFWQNLLWYSELQAYEDIKLFDLHSAVLQRSGRFFKLHVAGLAEGRPSVLRGDLIISKWKGKEYRGRVYAVELLDVLVEFHESFHKRFNVSVDRVDLVRFTFTRTSFRTSHAGCLAAPKTMGARMLAPQTRHVRQIQRSQYQRRGSNNDQVSQQQQRVVPQKFAWGCHSLNEEQKKAVKEIAKGLLRPMPYCIFGPPGTGYVRCCCCWRRYMSLYLRSFLTLRTSIFCAYLEKPPLLSKPSINWLVCTSTIRSKPSSRFC